MKSLIFGASGFIGSHLVKRLKNEGHEVFACPHDEIRLLSVEYFEKVNPDYIFYLSAYGNRYDQVDEVETIRVNIRDLYRVLVASSVTKYKAFINFSSSSVALPYETMYSATKAAGEHIGRAYANKYNKPIVNIRPFTVIGKGDNPDHLLPKLIDSCLHNTPMSFVGDPVHDYIGVHDLVDAVLMVAERAEQLKGQTVDVGSGFETSNDTIRKIVERVTNKKANLNIVESMRPYDGKSWKANPSVLWGLGWQQNELIEMVVRSMLG